MSRKEARIGERDAPRRGRGVRCVAALPLAWLAVACTLGFHHGGGPCTLLPANAPGGPTDSEDAAGAAERDVSAALELVLPPDWNWFERGHDLVATRDGVFLQNLLVERIHVDQRDESVVGAFPMAAISAKQWPIRTVRRLTRRFVRGMAPLDAAAVLLESRRNDPLVADLAVSELSPRTVAGQPGFKVVYEFRLRPPGPEDLEIGAYGWSPFDVQGRTTPYRTTCYGFLRGAWFYAVECTAARRHYADADAEIFDAIAQSVRLADG